MQLRQNIEKTKNQIGVYKLAYENTLRKSEDEQGQVLEKRQQQQSLCAEITQLNIQLNREITTVLEKYTALE